MARPNWEYIRVDVLLPDNPKLDGLTYASKWTLIELWCHCGQRLSDGFVRDAAWKRFGTPAARRQIVERGLAERVSGGYQMHDYLEHQRSRDEVTDLKAKRSDSGRKGGLAKANAKQVLKQTPEQTLKQNSGKSLAEAEAEAEAEQKPTGAGAIGGDVEGVIHSPPQAIQLPSGPWLNGAAARSARPDPPASPRGRAETDTERRRQAAALDAWAAEHPEGAASALPA